ncbi:MAG: hypothetical protein IJK96_07405 [Bacteroidales bacterium]|nr:hypothetical protein [Bacteroidales bacterium]
MKRILPVLTVILAAAACSRPVSVEKFIKASDCPVPDRYDFVLDMADTLVSYDITFYTRLSRGDGSLLLSIPLTVSATSPSGKLYSEDVWADVSSPESVGHFDRDFIIPYRSEVRPAEAGEWKLSVTVPSGMDCLGGVGCILKRRK